jgi:hypothetical protein
MLAFLRESGKASERKLRLFAIACCRKVWRSLKDERSERAIEVLERWVDGQASRQELMAAHDAAWKAWGAPARTAVADATAVEWDAGHAANAANHAAWASAGGSRADAQRSQAVLLRCIVGNPFCSSPAIAPAMLTWNDGLIPRLAEAAHDVRLLPEGPLDVARLGVLGDALEDAGWGDGRLLDHLHSPGPHARGCWALDLLLSHDH